ncbi:MAG: hypothetical protein IKM73_00200 [Acidaminococcaceae bacterium]|nr:hypothetical protein [Acidaminococcaceae bacterium]
MIEVIYPQNYRRCQCCGAKAFREYAFRMNNQGVIVALCLNCINVLHALTYYPHQEQSEEGET